MLRGVTSYGSDSESDGESNVPSPPPTNGNASSLPKQANPAPKASSTTSSSSLALPAPKKRRDGPVRITVEAPKFEDEDEERAPKKPRTVAASGGGTKGAGSSSLFSALPAPKNATPVAPEPKRVLGGGGGPALSFASVSSASTSAPQSEEKSTSNGLFLPPSMAKGKAKEVLPTVAAAPAVDFFSLGSTTKAAPAIPALDAPITSSITLSSAPAVKDFEPPEPSPYDPYPGYYQLPSGEWAAHDPVVYKKFMQRLTSGVDMQAGNQTKSEAKEFAARSEDNMATFDPNEELRQGQIAEREKRKAITTTPAGAPAVPRMKVQKSTGLARSRHQLSTLLHEAYENREALEEKIAQGKRNRKEAGTKYGF